MKIIGEILASGQAEGRAEVAGRARSARAVQRTVNHPGLLADVFHDVDFAALGPADRSDVFAQHPEGRPHPLPHGNFDARFEAAVRLIEKPLRFHSRRGVIASDVVAGIRVGFFQRRDNEIAALELGVLRAIGVRLELVVAPAVAANPGIKGPFRRIGRGAVRAAEFVAPDKSESLGGRRLQRRAASAT